MSKKRQANTQVTRLPKEFVDRQTNLFARFLSIEAAGGAVLLLFTFAAHVLSNSQWAHLYENAWKTSVGPQLGSFEFTRSLREWNNDGLKPLFFPLSRWTFPGTWVVLAGIGFTMALFIANLVFSQNLIESAKLGIFLASAVSAVAGIMLLSGLFGHGRRIHMAPQ